MRGSRVQWCPVVSSGGIIPAHAGLTSTLCAYKLSRGDHPRACGAHGIEGAEEPAQQGSSPRMRGSRAFGSSKARRVGIIPAHAGLTTEAD